jgi:chromosome segregation ATPase
MNDTETIATLTAQLDAARRENKPFVDALWKADTEIAQLTHELENVWKPAAAINERYARAYESERDALRAELEAVKSENDRMTDFCIGLTGRNPDDIRNAFKERDALRNSAWATEAREREAAALAQLADLRAQLDAANAQNEKLGQIVVEYKTDCGCPICRRTDCELADLRAQLSEEADRRDNMEKACVEAIKLREVAEARLEACRRDSERQWQPIETAPKCTAEGRVPVIVTYSPHVGHHAPMAIARLTRDGWISGKQGNHLWFKPTHWMPLPSPPIAAIDAAQGLGPKREAEVTSCRALPKIPLQNETQP